MKALRHAALKSVASRRPRASMETPNGRKKRVFERLAHPAKRHYTFARRRLHGTWPPAANTAYQAPNALISRLFCSLRLSVRTPPFHGGESGSIPLGSANSFNDLPPLPAAPSNKWTKNVRAHGASTRHHVADTFQAQGDHFQGLREPLSRPKFHPLRRPANGHWCVRMRGQGNGYGRHCDHNLRGALPRTPPDVAGLLSAGYLTALTSLGIVICAGNERCPGALTRQRLLKNTLSTKQGYSDVSTVAGDAITPAGGIRRTLLSLGRASA